MAAIISVPGYYYYQRGGLNNSGRLEPSQRWLDHFFRVIEMRGRHPSFSKSIFPYTSRKKLSNSSLYLFICAKGFPFNQISLSLYSIIYAIFSPARLLYVVSSTVYRMESMSYELPPLFRPLGLGVVLATLWKWLYSWLALNTKFNPAVATMQSWKLVDLYIFYFRVYRFPISYSPVLQHISFRSFDMLQQQSQSGARVSLIPGCVY